ncbi:hypothetical protein COV93_06315, partial [Candidatus Woesearchaeota archaeon CG11_big_fil_rev_8_21_14_0_20_43_8]
EKILAVIADTKGEYILKADDITVKYKRGKGLITEDSTKYKVQKEEDSLILTRKRTIDDMVMEADRIASRRDYPLIESSFSRSGGMLVKKWSKDDASIVQTISKNRITGKWQLVIKDGDIEQSYGFSSQVKYEFRDEKLIEVPGLLECAGNTGKKTNLDSFYGNSPELKKLYSRIPALKHNVSFNFMRSFGGGLLNGSLGGTILSFLGQKSWYMIGAMMTTNFAIWFGESFFTKVGKKMISSHSPASQSSKLSKHLEYSDPLTTLHSVVALSRFEEELYNTMKRSGGDHKATYQMNYVSRKKELLDDRTKMAGFLDDNLESLLKKVTTIDRRVIADNAKMWFDSYGRYDLLDPRKRVGLEIFLCQQYPDLVVDGTADGIDGHYDLWGTRKLLERRISSALRDPSHGEMEKIINNGVRYIDIAVDTNVAISGLNIGFGGAAWLGQYLGFFGTNPAVASVYLAFFLGRGLLSGFAMAGGNRIRQLVSLEVYRRSLEKDAYADANSAITEYTSINSRRMQIGAALGNGIAFGSLALAPATGGASLIATALVGAGCYGYGLYHYSKWKKKIKKQFSEK